MRNLIRSERARASFATALRRPGGPFYGDSAKAAGGSLLRGDASSFANASADETAAKLPAPLPKGHHPEGQDPPYMFLRNEPNLFRVKTGVYVVE